MATISPVELPSQVWRRHTPTANIQQIVALSFGLHPNHMTSISRTHAWPRQVAMYLTRQITKRSLPTIGQAFGGRHHTTVLHAIRKVERQMQTDPFDKADVKALRKAIEG